MNEDLLHLVSQSAWLRKRPKAIEISGSKRIFCKTVGPPVAKRPRACLVEYLASKLVMPPTLPRQHFARQPRCDIPKNTREILHSIRSPSSKDRLIRPGRKRTEWIFAHVRRRIRPLRHWYRRIVRRPWRKWLLDTVRKWTAVAADRRREADCQSRGRQVCK